MAINVETTNVAGALGERRVEHETISREGRVGNGIFHIILAFTLIRATHRRGRILAEHRLRGLATARRQSEADVRRHPR